MPLVTVLQLSADEFRAAREAIGWSNRELCRRLGCSRSVGSTWELGTARVPVPVGEWLTAVADAIAHYPPPANWRTRAVGKREAA
jgi:transcriptional regulator with XRE-family HTH domain